MFQKVPKNQLGRPKKKNLEQSRPINDYFSVN